MATYLAEDTDLSSVANAIRSITGISGSLTFPSAFVSAINGITALTPDMKASVKAQKHLYEDITTKETFMQAIMLNDLPSVVRSVYSSSTNLVYVSKPTGTAKKSIYSYYNYFSSKVISIPNAYDFYVTSYSGAAAGFLKNDSGSIILNGVSKGFTGTMNSYSASITGTVSFTYCQDVPFNYWEKETFTWARNIDNTTIKIIGSGVIPSFESTENSAYWKALPFQDVIFDGSITGVGSYAFAYCQNLKSINLPVCQYIYNSAFVSCQSLSYVSAPECTTIGEYAFNKCSSMTTANFPECTTIGECAFSNCSSMTTASFQKCTTIGQNAFYYCTKLDTISFPSCTTIGAYAFTYCGLSIANFPACVSVEDDAFSHCSKLDTISFPSCTTIGAYAFASCGLSIANFPACVSVEACAFISCSKLVSAYLPNITVITSSMFYSCSSMTTISVHQGCTEIGAYAFWDCYRLTQASFPNCTKVIGYAFYNCSSLANAYFPECLEIGMNTFESCSSLEVAYFPKCSIIDTRAFRYCSALSTVDFTSCQKVGMSAFYGCSNLSVLSLPNCSLIENYAFAYCQALESLYLMSTSFVSMNYLALQNTPMSYSTYLGRYGSIYVPASMLNSYKTMVGFSKYSSRIVGV